MLGKCCTQYVSKCRKLSSGHRAGEGQFSFQSQRKVMPKNAQVSEWVKVTQSCLTLCNPMDYTVHGILQARILKWVAFSFSKECSNYSVALISHSSKVMLKILQDRLQQYMNCELPDIQAGFRKDRGTRDQIANICWIIEKAREFQKNIYFCFIDYAKAFDCVEHNKL